MKELKDLIKFYREKLDLSQRELGEKCGVSNAEISRIESGERRNPSPETLKLISAHIGIPYQELMYFAGYLDFNDIKEYLPIIFKDVGFNGLVGDKSKITDEWLKEFLINLRMTQK